MAAADLITLDRLLDALDKVPGDMEAYEIDKFESAIRSASTAIRNYTDRDFTLNESGVATSRKFEYDESGYIDIDDAQSITSVMAEFDYGSTLTFNGHQWRAMPFNGPVKDTIIITQPLFYGMSREMGFTFNLDTFEGPELPPVLEVTAVWGWPAIPEDVQQATVWTATAFAEEEKSVSSENISSFGRSYAVRSASAIPLRARELLDQYKRIQV